MNRTRCSGQEDDLVAFRVPETERAELGAAARRVRSPPLPRTTRCGSTSSTPSSCSATASPKVRNISRYGAALRVQLVELLPVVDDRRAVREGLRAEAVLRVEVRDGEEEGQPGRELLGVPAHDLAVARAHPGVDDEHGPGAADDADVRDERDASVRDDEDTVGDLDRCVFDHGGVRGVCLGFGHDLSFPPAPMLCDRRLPVDERYERGLDAYASQFGIPREDVAQWFTDRYGERFGTEAINAAGGAWADDALSLRDRSLVVVAALISQGGVEERLRGHVRWAIDHGSTRDELEALATLLAVYVGYARASVGLEIIREELARLEAGPQ